MLLFKFDHCLSNFVVFWKLLFYALFAFTALLIGTKVNIFVTWTENFILKNNHKVQLLLLQGVEVFHKYNL